MLPGASFEISRRNNGGKARSTGGKSLSKERRILTVPKMDTVLWNVIGAELGADDNAALFPDIKMPGASLRVLNSGNSIGEMLSWNPLHIPADERQTTLAVPFTEGSNDVMNDTRKYGTTIQSIAVESISKRTMCIISSEFIGAKLGVDGNVALFSTLKDAKKMPGASFGIARRVNGGKAISIGGIFFVYVWHIPDDRWTLAVPKMCTVLWNFIGAESFPGPHSKDKTEMPSASYRMWTRRPDDGKAIGALSNPLHVLDGRQTLLMPDATNDTQSDRHPPQSMVAGSIQGEVCKIPSNFVGAGLGVRGDAINLPAPYWHGTRTDLILSPAANNGTQENSYNSSSSNIFGERIGVRGDAFGNLSASYWHGTRTDLIVSPAAKNNTQAKAHNSSSNVLGAGPGVRGDAFGNLSAPNWHGTRIDNLQKINNSQTTFQSTVDNSPSSDAFSTFWVEHVAAIACLVLLVFALWVVSNIAKQKGRYFNAKRRRRQDAKETDAKLGRHKIHKLRAFDFSARDQQPRVVPTSVVGGAILFLLVTSYCIDSVGAVSVAQQQNGDRGGGHEQGRGGQQQQRRQQASTGHDGVPDGGAAPRGGKAGGGGRATSGGGNGNMLRRHGDQGGAERWSWRPWRAGSGALSIFDTHKLSAQRGVSGGTGGEGGGVLEVVLVKGVLNGHDREVGGELGVEVGEFGAR